MTVDFPRDRESVLALVENLLNRIAGKWGFRAAWSDYHTLGHLLRSYLRDHVGAHIDEKAAQIIVQEAVDVFVPHLHLRIQRHEPRDVSALATALLSMLANRALDYLTGNADHADSSTEFYFSVAARPDPEIVHDIFGPNATPERYVEALQDALTSGDDIEVAIAVLYTDQAATTGVLEIRAWEIQEELRTRGWNIDSDTVLTSLERFRFRLNAAGGRTGVGH